MKSSIEVNESMTKQRSHDGIGGNPPDDPRPGEGVRMPIFGSGRTRDLLVKDVTGQRTANVRGVPGDATASELIQSLVAGMGLPSTDPNGTPVTYRARLDREGRYLRNRERIDEAIEDGNQLTLRWSVDAA